MKPSTTMPGTMLILVRRAKKTNATSEKSSPEILNMLKGVRLITKLATDLDQGHQVTDNKETPGQGVREIKVQRARDPTDPKKGKKDGIGEM